MLTTIATGFLPRFAQKRLGSTPVKPIDVMLITTGAALTVRKQRLLLGLALLTLGGYRIWKEAQSEDCATLAED